MSHTGIAIGAAILAGGSLSATGVLQQRAASRQPANDSLSPRLLLDLAKDRVWLEGIGSGFLAYGFQAVALAFGALALVQPIFVSELIFAVPISMRLNRMGMNARIWAGLLCVAGGLALGIIAADPHQGNPLAPIWSWAIVLIAVAGAAGLAVGIGRARADGAVRSSLFAFAAAIVMALQSALLTATVALFKHGIVAVLTSWEGYALIPATAAGMTLIMSAYQAGPLAASMPVIDACEPAAAIIIGLLLFGEHVRFTPLAMAGELAGLALFFVGIVVLDTSPLVQALQRKQDKDTGRQPQKEPVGAHQG